MQRQTAQWMIYTEIVETIPSVLVTLVIGPISNVKGRKCALVLPLIGSFAMYLVFTLILVLDLPYTLSLIGAFINGICGAQALMFTAAFSYIADVSNKEDTVMRMTILDTVYTLASAVAMVYMGYIIKALDFVYPFIILIALICLNMLYVIFIMPESIESVKDLREMENPVKQIQKAFTTITKPTIKEHGWKLKVGFIANSLIVIAVIGSIRMQSLFAMDDPLCWGPVLIGYHGAATSVLTNVGKLLLAAYAIPRITEVGSIILGLVFGGLSMIIQSVAVQTWIMFMGM